MQITPETLETLKSELSGVAPYFTGYISTLGGVERASALLCFSLDSKDDWSNGILENSRYMRFHIDTGGEIEQFTKSHKIPVKFRRCTVKDTAAAVAKIKQYFAKIA